MLKLNNIKKIYKSKKNKEVIALNDVSISFPDKGMVFILGKSGSGKSTLLNILGGLDEADSGELIINNKSSKDFTKSDFDGYRNNYIGFIFQEYNLLDNLNVKENISLASEIQGKKITDEEIENILKKVNLAGFSLKKTSELSGGEKQRVVIARAIAKSSEIILADEPSGALDSETSAQIFELLKELSKNKLVVVVSHDREFAEIYGDRVIEFKDGKIFSDSLKNETNLKNNKTDELKLVKSKLSFKNTFKLALNSLKVKPFRLALTLLLSFTSFTAFGVIDTIVSFNKADIATNELKNKPDKSGYILKEYRNTDMVLGDYYSQSNISKKDFYDFNEKYDVNSFALLNRIGRDVYITFPYNLVNMSDDFFNSTSFYNIYNNFIGAIESNASKIQELGFEIYGEYPSNYDEIALTDYQIEVLNKFGVKVTAQANSSTTGFIEKGEVKKETLIGNILYFGKYKLKVTGIIDTNIDLTTSSPYFEFMNEKYDEIEIDELSANEKNLYNKMVYDVYKSFSGAVYLKEGFVDEIVIPSLQEEIETWDFINGGSRVELYLKTGDKKETVFTNYSLNSISNVKEGVIFFDENYNSLSKNDIVLPFNYLSTIIDIAEKNELIELKEGDKTREDLVYRLVFTYDESGNPTYKIDKNEIKLKFNSFEQVFNTVSKKEIFEYSLNNFPKDNAMFEKFVKEFYRYKENDYYIEYLGNFTDELKAFAYYSLITDFDNITNKLRNKFDTDTIKFLSNHYQYGNTNAFGGLTLAGFTNIHTIKKFKEYDPLSKFDEISGVIDCKDFFDQDFEYKENILNVRGVLLGARDYGSALIICDEKYKEIYQKSFYNYVYSGILVDYRNNEKFLDEIIKESYDESSNIRFSLKNEVDEAIEPLNMILSKTIPTILFCAVGLLIFSALLLMNFIFVSISYKNKDIGILRALGARPIDVLKIFIGESLIISFITSLLAIIASAVSLIFINQMANTFGLSGAMFIFGIKQIAIILSISILVAIISSAIPILIATRKKPIDVIKEK